MRIATITALWKRPHIARVMLANLEYLREQLAGEIDLVSVVVGSEREESQTLAEGFGACYIEFPNQPLGAKWNAALKEARKLNPNGVIVLGSNNLLDVAGIRYWARAIEDGAEFMGTTDGYMYSTHGEFIHWRGYFNHRKGEPLGSGRCFSSGLLDRTDWHLWNDELNRSLDFSVINRLDKLDPSPARRIVSMEAAGIHHLGIRPAKRDPNWVTLSGTIANYKKHAAPGQIVDLSDPEVLVGWFGPYVGNLILGRESEAEEARQQGHKNVVNPEVESDVEVFEDPPARPYAFEMIAQVIQRAETAALAKMHADVGESTPEPSSDPGEDPPTPEAEPQPNAIMGAMQLVTNMLAQHHGAVPIETRPPEDAPEPEVEPPPPAEPEFRVDPLQVIAAILEKNALREQLAALEPPEAPPEVEASPETADEAPIEPVHRPTALQVIAALLEQNRVLPVQEAPLPEDEPPAAEGETKPARPIRVLREPNPLQLIANIIERSRKVKTDPLPISKALAPDAPSPVLSSRSPALTRDPLKMIAAVIRQFKPTPSETLCSWFGDKVDPSEDRDTEILLDGFTNPFRVVVTTYNRPKLCGLLLDDLEQQAFSGLHVVVYDDASTKDYSEIERRLKARGWEYVRAKSHHGREKYWKWCGRILRDCRLAPQDQFLMTADDMRLCRAFFHRVDAIWNTIPDAKKISLNVLRDSRNSNWTGVTPRPVMQGWAREIGWFDGEFYFRRKLLNILASESFQVPEAWFSDPKRSTGMWCYTVRKLHAQGWRMYGTTSSLVAHVGKISQMNPASRAETPLLAVNFIDGEKAHDKILTESSEKAPRRASSPALPRFPLKQEVTASVASIPTRVEALQQVVAAILPQVDRLCVYLNGGPPGHAYETVPDFLGGPKIEVARYDISGDRGDGGKFFWCRQYPGYHFTLDDDINYPPDYVNEMIRAITRHDLKAVVGVLGARFRVPNVYNYFGNRWPMLALEMGLEDDVLCHVLGTGTVAYHTSAIPLEIDQFVPVNMADIHLAVQAKKHDVPMISVKRPDDWLTAISVPGPTIFNMFNRGANANTQVQTKLVADVSPWADLPEIPFDWETMYTRALERRQQN